MLKIEKGNGSYYEPQCFRRGGQFWRNSSGVDVTIRDMATPYIKNAINKVRAEVQAEYNLAMYHQPQNVRRFLNRFGSTDDMAVLLSPVIVDLKDELARREESVQIKKTTPVLAKDKKAKTDEVVVSFTQEELEDYTRQAVEKIFNEGNFVRPQVAPGCCGAAKASQTKSKVKKTQPKPVEKVKAKITLGQAINNLDLCGHVANKEINALPEILGAIGIGSLDDFKFFGVADLFCIQGIYPSALRAVFTLIIGNRVKLGKTNQEGKDLILYDDACRSFLGSTHQNNSLKSQISYVNGEIDSEIIPDLNDIEDILRRKRDLRKLLTDDLNRKSSTTTRQMREKYLSDHGSGFNYLFFDI